MKIMVGLDGGGGYFTTLINFVKWVPLENKNEMNRALGHFCGPGEPPEDGEMRTT